MAQIISFPKPDKHGGYLFELNGKKYEVYPVNGRWMWRSGQWWAFDFRKGGSFDCYAEAAQDAMRDARANG